MEAVVTVKEIAEKLAQYEEEHDVCDYSANGWRVWPYLRVRLGLAMLASAGSSKEEVDAEQQRSVICRRTRIYSQLLVDSIEVNLSNAVRRVSCSARCRDVLLIGSGGYQLVAGRWVSPHLDPLTDLFSKKGLRCLTWQDRTAPGPMFERAAVIPPLLFPRIADRLSIGRSMTPSDPPAWFLEFSDFWERCTNQSLDWISHVHRPTKYIWIRSKIMEKWLRRSGVRLVINDCWYNDEALSATSSR